MSLPYGILGLLSYQDSSGYDLSLMFANSLNNFWHAQSSQIYRELKRLEEQGLVSSKKIIQDNKPNKRVYSLNEKGKTKLDDWLKETKPEMENAHFSLLMKVFFGAENPQATIELLQAYKQECLQILDTFAMSSKQAITAYAASLTDGKEKSLYWKMTLDLGIANVNCTIKWIDDCLDLIEKDLKK